MHGSNRKQPYSFSKRLYKLRWRIESAFKAEGLPAHRNPLRQTGAKLPGFCLPRRSSCMVDLMSLGPSYRSSIIRSDREGDTSRLTMAVKRGEIAVGHLGNRAETLGGPSPRRRQIAGA